MEEFLGLPRAVGKMENYYYNETKGFHCLKDAGCLGSTKGMQHPEVSKDLEQELRRYFAPYNHKLYKLVGYDFGWKEDLL